MDMFVRGDLDRKGEDEGFEKSPAWGWGPGRLLVRASIVGSRNRVEGSQKWRGGSGEWVRPKLERG